MLNNLADAGNAMMLLFRVLMLSSQHVSRLHGAYVTGKLWMQGATKGLSQC